MTWESTHFSVLTATQNQHSLISIYTYFTLDELVANSYEFVQSYSYVFVQSVQCQLCLGVGLGENFHAYTLFKNVMVSYDSHHTNSNSVVLKTP